MAFDFSEISISNPPQAVAGNGAVWLAASRPFGYEVHRSEDSGETWGSTSGAPSNANGMPVLLGAGGIWIWVGTVYITRSTDDGDSWTTVQSDLGGAGETNFEPHMPNSVYTPDGQTWLVGGGAYFNTDYALWRSTDAGVTWTMIPCGLDRVTSIVKHDGTLYAFGRVGFSTYGVITSNDEGATWSSVSSANINLDYGAVSTGDEFIALTHGDKVYVSSDGAAWAELFADLGSLSNEQLDGQPKYVADGARIAVIYPTGVLLTSEDGGESWTATEEFGSSGISGPPPISVNADSDVWVVSSEFWTPHHGARAEISNIPPAFWTGFEGTREVRRA